MVTWAEFERLRPDLAQAGRELFYFFGVGLAFLATVRKDGGPRLHPVCPVIVDSKLLAFVIPSPKLRDLLHDGRYALHSYPLPDNEDVVYLTGKARAISDAGVRAVAEGKFLEERDSLALDLSAQTLVEFTIETCLLTRTTGHGDENPQHTVWHAMDR
ncbi:MAG TPA: pyridoxamine 5'-phosphate oxidase family protein [Dehalococcoidia bacterium]|nr:pyridoxamine 5'-phosphate oxidase family protein [Dehalococcoidia bacterium]